MTCEDMSSVTFSLESRAGQRHFDWLSGHEQSESGPGVVHANHSRRQGSRKARPTNATSGPSFDASSPSAVLQSCLSSRLRQKLAVPGSPEYVLTLKEWPMPSGPPIFAARASARRTSGSACGGWPTPMSGNPGTETYNPAGNTDYSRKVEEVAGWQTARKTDGEKGIRSSEGARAEFERKGTGADLPTVGATAGWASPASRDYRYPNTESYQDRSDSKKGEQLNNQVVHQGSTEGWPTPNAMAGGSTSRSRDRKDELLISGLIQPLGPAPTASRGVLAPEFSRWLMGYRALWDEAAPGSAAWKSVQQELTALAA
jgi:hypothetical protein